MIKELGPVCVTAFRQTTHAREFIRMTRHCGGVEVTLRSNSGRLFAVSFLAVSYGALEAETSLQYFSCSLVCGLVRLILSRMDGAPLLRRRFYRCTDGWTMLRFGKNVLHASLGRAA